MDSELKFLVQGSIIYSLNTNNERHVLESINDSRSHAVEIARIVGWQEDIPGEIIDRFEKDWFDALEGHWSHLDSST